MTCVNELVQFRRKKWFELGTFTLKTCPFLFFSYYKDAAWRVQMIRFAKNMVLTEHKSSMSQSLFSVEFRRSRSKTSQMTWFWRRYDANRTYFTPMSTSLFLTLMCGVTLDIRTSYRNRTRYMWYCARISSNNSSNGFQDSDFQNIYVG